MKRRWRLIIGRSISRTSNALLALFGSTGRAEAMLLLFLLAPLQERAPARDQAREGRASGDAPTVFIGTAVGA